MINTLNKGFVALTALCLGAVSMTETAEAQSLYKNYMAGKKADVVKNLSLWRGTTDRLTVANWKVGNRGGGKLRIQHRRDTTWQSILGRPNLSESTRDAKLEFAFYGPAHSWVYRWLGKFPGLQPSKPHFGGNAKDDPVWDRHSARLMWFGLKPRILRGDDTSARPSAYLYLQTRKKGQSGAHHRSSLEFGKNQWYQVEMDVKLNNHNSNRVARNNSEVDLFINGKLEKAVRDRMFVGDIPRGKSIRSAEIVQVAFHNYYGGRKTDPLMVPDRAETYMFIDDVFVTQN